jgi:ADP-ribosylglycohydrolase
VLTTGSYADAVLRAVNLGDDTDTVGCVAGGLAGLHYGIEAVPLRWRSALARHDELADWFTRFGERVLGQLAGD